MSFWLFIRLSTVLFGALLVTLCATGAQQKGGKETGLPRATAGSGKQTYMHYCSACRGADARGNGPAAVVRRTSPPDLTTRAKRHGGKFPYEYVFDVLRFGTRFASHGSSEMPIWGAIFGSMENYDEVAARKRIKGLSDYLASLQQKESWVSAPGTRQATSSGDHTGRGRVSTRKQRSTSAR
jgi:hypothetical protein